MILIADSSSAKCDWVGTLGLVCRSRGINAASPVEVEADSAMEASGLDEQAARALLLRWGSVKKALEHV